MAAASLSRVYRSVTANRAGCVVRLLSSATNSAHAMGLPNVVVSPHFRTPRAVKVVQVPALPGTPSKNTEEDYMLSHAVYSDADVNAVQVTHVKPETFSDRVALAGITALRKSFDWVTGYGDKMTVKKYLTRIIFLETVAGVPGMVGAVARHLRSLRTLQRDFGWVHTLLEEAENERMHLLTFTNEDIQAKKPSVFMRAMILGGQGVFFNFYFVAYMLAPRVCHRFVGFLEEEAVKTYTHAIEDLDAGKLPEWSNKPAPPIAVKYWRLKEGANMRDLLLAVRADEAIHRDVNHTLAVLPEGVKNPFA